METCPQEERKQFSCGSQFVTNSSCPGNPAIMKSFPLPQAFPQLVDGPHLLMGYSFKDELFKGESSPYCLFLKSSSSLGTEIFFSWKHRTTLLSSSVQTSHGITAISTSAYLSMEAFARYQFEHLHLPIVSCVIRKKSSFSIAYRRTSAPNTRHLLLPPIWDLTSSSLTSMSPCCSFTCLHLVPFSHSREA